MAFDPSRFYQPGKAPVVSSGPVKNPNTSTWNPGTGGIPRPGGYPVSNPDPFNWAQIAADLKKEEELKAAAKRRNTQPAQQRVVNPSAPTALTPESQRSPEEHISAWQQVEAWKAYHNGELPPGMTPEYAAQLQMAAGQAQAPANPTGKQLLDAYRAFHNGELPPGMTPEVAAQIDAGADPNALAIADPSLAPVIAQFQQLLTQLPADYAAGKASVQASYNNLTGDVLDSGKQWMQDLYGRVVDPNDPNAALAQKDPALTAYAQSMSQLEETGDLNEATDLAWFDKMQANAAATYQGLIASLAAQPPAALDGGGGGGGGGGRGGRGGGGGGGNVNDWKTPTNTLTNVTSATDTATQTDTGYSPGFYEALMEATSSDPDLQALTQRIWEGSSQDARGMTQETAKRLTEAETQLENQQLQRGQHEAWFQNTPNLVKAAVAKMLQNKGAVLGDDPLTKEVREKYYIPRQEGGNTPQVYVPSPEQAEQNALADELINLRSPTATSKGIEKMLYKPGKAPVRKMPVGVLSPAGQLEWETQGAISPAQIKVLAQHGQRGLTEAQKGDTTEQPFNWKSWAEGGGYVPETDSKVRKDTEQNIEMYNFILDSILPWNPNATTVPTQEKLVSQGKDSSTYQSKNTNKSFTNALPGSPLDLTPSFTDTSLTSNPVSNPEGFSFTVDDEGNETVDVSDLGLGFGEGIRPSVDPKKMDALAALAFSKGPVKSAAAKRASGWDVFKRPTKTAAPVKKAAASFTRNPPPKRPKMTAAKDKTPAKKWEIPGITKKSTAKKTPAVKKTTTKRPSTIYGRRT